MGNFEEETMNPVLNRLEIAESILEEARLKSTIVNSETVVESEASKIEEKVEEIEEEIDKMTDLPEEPADTLPSSKERRKVPPTTDEEVYEDWLETLEKSSEEESKSSTSESTSQEREKRERVPPTTDEEVYERWLETLED